MGWEDDPLSGQAPDAWQLPADYVPPHLRPNMAARIRAEELAEARAAEAAADQARAAFDAKLQAYQVQQHLIEAQTGHSPAELAAAREAASAAADTAGSWRDASAEYGSGRRPAVLLPDGSEVEPRIGGPVRRADFGAQLRDARRSTELMRTGPLAAMFAAYHARRCDAPALGATIGRAEGRRDHGDGEPHAAGAQPSPYGPGWITRVGDSRARIVG